MDSIQKVKMYVVSHKPFQRPDKNGYETIQVGFGEDMGEATRDNIGDHIADKNKTYCELTALYWIWKNDKDSDIVGICHYRRYFSGKALSKKEAYFLDSRQIADYLEHYDAIVPKKLYFPVTLWDNYYQRGCGKEEDLKKLSLVMEKKAPEYFREFEYVMKEKSGYFYNMFVMKKERFDEYCQWLFGILFELEKIVDLNGYTPQEQRIFGYLSEILLNVWLEKQQLKCKQIPVVNTECSSGKRGRMFLNNTIQKWKNS